MASRPASAASPSNSQVVRLSSTVATRDVSIQTSRAVVSASSSGPRVRVNARTATARMQTAMNKAHNPPPARIESAVLCAVSCGSMPAAPTNDPAPVPSHGACTNACQPALQMFTR